MGDAGGVALARYTVMLGRFAVTVSLALGVAGCLRPVGGGERFDQPDETMCALLDVEDIDVEFSEARFPKPAGYDLSDTSQAASTVVHTSARTSVEAHVDDCRYGATSWDSIAIDLVLPPGTTASLEARGSAFEPWSVVQPDLGAIAPSSETRNVPLGLDSFDGLDLRVGLVKTPGGEAPEVTSAVVTRTCDDYDDSDDC